MSPIESRPPPDSRMRHVDAPGLGKAEAAAVRAAFSPTKASRPGSAPAAEPMTGGRRALALLRSARDLPESFISSTEFAFMVAVILAMDQETGWSRRSIRRLAANAKVERQTGYKLVERLVDKGLLKCHRRAGRSPLLCISPHLFIGGVAQDDRVVALGDRPVAQDDKVVILGGHSSPPSSPHISEGVSPAAPGATPAPVESVEKQENSGRENPKAPARCDPRAAGEAQPQPRPQGQPLGQGRGQPQGRRRGMRTPPLFERRVFD